MPALAQEAQSIVDEAEDFTPDNSFNDAFDDKPEKDPEPEEKKETESEAEVEESDSETEEQESEEQEESSEPEESEEKSEEQEELSALEQAEAQARKKFSKKDEKEEKEGTDDTKTEAPEEIKDESAPEIDFTDVDSNPGQYIKNLIEQVEDKGQRDRYQEVMSQYPEFGEIAALAARDLTSRQTVKTVGAPTMEMPDDIKTQLESFDGFKKELEDLRLYQAEQQFFDAVEKDVPGAKSISRTDKFQGWLDNQTVGVKMLSESADPDDAVAVLKAYKEYEARLVAKNVDEDNKKKKKKVDSSGKKVVKSTAQTQIENADDFSAGFNS